MLKLLAAPALAGALCCAVTPAMAGGNEIGSVMTVTGELRGVTRAQTVSLRDLDLRLDAQVARAETRIRYASRQVCDPSAAEALYQKRDFGRCFDAALTGARGELDRHVATARGS
jgi:UrcA family protein